MRRVLERAPVAVAGLAAVVAAAFVMAADAASGPSLLVPAGHHAFPSWLAGPLVGLGERATADGIGLLLVVLLAGWIAALIGARRLDRRAVIGAIVAAHVACLLAPPLFSADVFGYIGFARLGAVHHLDPYVFGTASAPHDAVHPFLRWHDARSPYGPLFTLLSYAIVPFGIAGALWSYKVLAFAASLATVALVWRLAERRGHDPRLAAVLVGLNPPLLAFAIGGGHNDVLVTLLTVAGIALVLEQREGAGLAAIVLGAATKISGGVVAPFALMGSASRGRALIGAGVAAVAVGVVSVAAFNGDVMHTISGSATAANGVATFSVPSTLARQVGADGIAGSVRTLLAAAGLAWVAGQLARTVRGADWITCAGWATLGLLCCSTWLVPWYATWLMPLAALGDSRRLRGASIAFTAFVTLTRVRFVPL